MNPKLLPLFIFHGIDKLLFFTITPNFPYAAWKSGWLSESQLALFFVVQIFCYRLFPLVGGYLADRFDKNRVMVLGSVIQAAGMISLCASTSATQLLFAGGLIGMGGGILNPAIYARISQLADAESERAFSTHYLLINLGAMLGPLVVWPLLTTNSLYALFILAAAIVWLNFSTPHEIQAHKSANSIAWFSPLRDRVFLQVLALFAGIWACYTMIFSSVPLISAQLGNQFEGNLWLGLNSLTVLCAFFWSTRRQQATSTSNTAWKKILIGLVLTVLGIVCAGIASHLSLVVLGIVLLSIGELMAIPVLYNFVSQHAPVEAKSRYFGFIWVAGAFGEAGAQALLWAISNPRAVCFISAGLLVAVMLSTRSLRDRVQA